MYPHGYSYPLPLPHTWAAPMILLAALVGCLLVLAGKGRRIGFFLCFGTAFHFEGVDISASFTLHKIFVVTFLLLLAAPGRAPDGRACQATVRMLQASLVLIYLASGLSKSLFGDWLKQGDVVYTHVVGVYRTDAAVLLIRNLPAEAWAVMQYVVLVFELGAFLWLTLPYVRVVGVLFGLCFHLMIALMMKDLIFFSLQMWCFYAVFLTAEEWRSIAKWIMKPLSSALAVVEN